jgi:redox-sensitive bicupin YhaK (pirin superfamily)
MNNWRKWLTHRKAQLGALAVACLPLMARAEWNDTLNTELTNFRVGLYALTGTIAVGTMVWKGAQWLIARSQGDHSVTVMDYLQQCGVILLVGGSLSLGVYLWGVFGSGSVG